MKKFLLTHLINGTHVHCLSGLQILSYLIVITLFVACEKDKGGGTGDGPGTVLANITELNCSGATNNGVLIVGVAASNVSTEVAYAGGNGGTYDAQTITSTGVTGLTATLAAGSVSNGTGSFTYLISGTPATSGTANFSLSIGGKNCTLSRSVIGGNASHSCGAPDVHNPAITYDSITDQEGNVYKTVKIGTQTWMAENLKVTKYRSGASISNITDSIEWRNTIVGAYCSYNNNTTNDCPYGKLYNWYAVNTNLICPSGWHVPTDAEWNNLVANLDSSYIPDAPGTQSANGGGKMKSTGTSYWQSSTIVTASNSSGFSGLPGGLRSAGFNTFEDLGKASYWWSATEVNISPGLAWIRSVSFGNNGISRGNYDKAFGFSVRCVKD